MGGRFKDHNFLKHAAFVNITAKPPSVCYVILIITSGASNEEAIKFPSPALRLVFYRARLWKQNSERFNFFSISSF